MDFFIPFFMSPLALSLYGVLGGLLVIYRLEITPRDSFKRIALAFLLLVLIVSDIALFVCTAKEPIYFRENLESIMATIGVYIFGLLVLLCLWGYKRAGKTYNVNLYDREHFQAPGGWRSPKFRKFAFLVLWVVSMVGFVSSEKQREYRIEMFEMRSEYSTKLQDMMEELTKNRYNDSLTSQDVKAYNDSLSAWSDRYKKVSEYFLFGLSSEVRECQKLLEEIQKSVERKEAFDRWRIEKSQRLISQLETFLSELPDRLDEDQYAYNYSVLNNLYVTCSGSYDRTEAADYFTPAAILLFEHCEHELDRRRQVKR